MTFDALTCIDPVTNLIEIVCLKGPKKQQKMQKSSSKSIGCLAVRDLNAQFMITDPNFMDTTSNGLSITPVLKLFALVLTLLLQMQSSRLHTKSLDR